VPPAANVAVTVLVAELKVVEQAPVPVQAPDHPENWLGAVAVSVSVTAVFGANVAVQPVVDPVLQLIPAGLLVTVPVPLPDVVTVKESPAVKVEVTLSAAVMVTLQVVVPVHAPPQPSK